MARTSFVAGANTFDAECNWWGQSTGPDQDPGSARRFGPADDAPWLLTSDLGGDCSAIGVDSAAADANGNEGDTLSSQRLVLRRYRLDRSRQLHRLVHRQHRRQLDWCYTPDR